MWQKYTKELCKRDLNDLDNHDGVVTSLEPDILGCEVKWVFGRITMNKASGGDRIPDELFQILKDDALTLLHSICQQIWKTQQWPHDWKSQFSFQSQRKAISVFKLLYNCTHFTCQQGYAQNASSQSSAVRELRTSRCTSWIQKRQRNQKSNYQIR